MNDLGNETASAVMNLTGKGLESLIEFMKYLSAHQDRKATRLANKLKQAQLKGMGKDEYRATALDYLNAKSGALKLKKLLRSGDKIIPLGETLNKKDYDRFSKLAKMYNVEFASTLDNTNKEKIKELKKDIKELEKEISEEAKQKIEEKKAEIERLESDKDIKASNKETIKELKEEIKELEKNITEEARQKIEEKKAEIEKLESQKEQHIIFIKSKDLDKVKVIAERMNKELKLNAINQQLEDIAKEGGDKDKEAELNKTKEELLTERVDELNKENNDKVLNGEYQSMSFDDVINDFTDKGVDMPPIIICERNQPNNYIEITSSEQAYENSPYTHIDTKFDVYRDGVKQECDLYKDKHKEFSYKHDRKGEATSNKGAENWLKLKDEMKQKGNFTNNVIVFSNIDEFNDYKQKYKKKTDNIKIDIKDIKSDIADGSIKDYAGAIKQLNGQLAECGIEINANKELCKAKTDKLIDINDLSAVEKMNYRKAVLISKQMDVYEKMNSVQTSLIMNKNNYEMTNDEGEKAKIQADINKLEADMLSLEKEAQNIQTEREDIASVEVLNEIENSRIENEENIREEERAEEITLGEEEKEEKSKAEANKQDKKSWENQIDNGNDKGGFGTDDRTKTKTRSSAERE